MKAQTLIAVVACVSGLFGCPGRTKPPDAQPEPNKPVSAPSVTLPATLQLDAIDLYLADQVKRGEFTGLSIAVMRHGKVVFAKGYGLRTIQGALPVTPTTQFAIGSNTKQLVCGTALLLQEEAKLQLNDKVAKYYPKLTRADDIRLIDALSHVSGYRDYYPLDFTGSGMTKDVAVESVVTKWGQRPLDFEPRSRWSYSNTGYLLVGRVLEKVSGKHLRTLMKTRIFDRVGMRHTQLADRRPAGSATGYLSFALGAPEVAPREGAGWLSAAGGVWSTPTDLLAWDLALVARTLLRPSSYSLMTSPAMLTDGRTTRYGCGLFVVHRHGETVLVHDGAVNGYLSYNAVVPRTRSGVVAMTNNSNAQLSRVVKGVLRLLVEADAPSIQAIRVSGDSPRVAALRFFRQMQGNRLHRGTLSQEFSAYLTRDRLAQAAPRLAALGEPKSVNVEHLGERGGLEVTLITFVFEKETIEGVMFRSQDGLIHELLFSR